MKIIGLAGIIALLLGVSSCDKDEQRSLENYWVSIASITHTNNDGTFTVQFDNGTSALTTENKRVSYDAITGQRVMINYALLSDSTGSQPRKIKINSISNVEIKQIGTLTAANQDSIGNDPIDVDEIWVGGNYLNVSFSFYGDKLQHLFSLVKNTTLTPSTDGMVHLELRHNAYEDLPKVQTKAIISFDLKAFANSINSSNVQMVIEAKNYTGNVTTFSLKYKLG